MPRSKPPRKKKSAGRTRIPSVERPDPEGSEIMRDAMFEAIDNQIRDRTPPETKQTYDRLKSEGFDHLETMKLIGCALSSELFYIMKEERVIDEEKYIESLQNLPELPWDDE